MDVHPGQRTVAFAAGHHVVRGRILGASHARAAMPEHAAGGCVMQAGRRPTVSCAVRTTSGQTWQQRSLLHQELCLWRNYERKKKRFKKQTRLSYCNPHTGRHPVEKSKRLIAVRAVDTRKSMAVHSIIHALSTRHILHSLRQKKSLDAYATATTPQSERDQEYHLSDYLVWNQEQTTYW